MLHTGQFMRKRHPGWTGADYAHVHANDRAVIQTSCIYPHLRRALPRVCPSCQTRTSRTSLFATPFFRSRLRLPPTSARHRNLIKPVPSGQTEIMHRGDWVTQSAEYTRLRGLPDGIAGSPGHDRICVATVIGTTTDQLKTHSPETCIAAHIRPTTRSNTDDSGRVSDMGDRREKWARKDIFSTI
ncbi:MAG: hypothetical protein ACFCUG_03110 [Thiotrichales bacterium]